MDPPASPPPPAPQPRYHTNDTGPFAAHTHTLQPTGPTSLNLDTRDTDMTIQLRPTATSTIHILHLENVRATTLVRAQRAVDAFLALDGAPLLDASTMSESFDDVHRTLVGYVEERGKGVSWAHGGFARAALRRAGNQPRYLVRVNKDGSVDTVTGTRGVSTRAGREEAATEVGDRGRMGGGVDAVQ